MKKFENLERVEQLEIIALFSTWLKPYTSEVIVRVMAKSEEIINDEFTMKLLIELRDREEAESREFSGSVEMLFNAFEDFKEYDPHNHAIVHAHSYRDVLYDMYIK